MSLNRSSKVLRLLPVSYTHLDVYKRQVLNIERENYKSNNYRNQQKNNIYRRLRNHRIKAEVGIIPVSYTHLETNSRIAEVGEYYQSFNVMTKELRATEVLQMNFVSDVSHEFTFTIFRICVMNGSSMMIVSVFSSCEPLTVMEGISSLV